MFFKKKTIKDLPDCDVFISSSHEDKRFVRRLVKELKSRGLKIWFDEDSVDVGKSLIDVIGEGIKSSRYVIAVLSKSYFKSPWAKAELKMLIHKEIHAGELSLLPLWHHIDAKDVYDSFPFISDRFSIPSSVGMSKVAYSIMKRIRAPGTYPMFSRRLSNYLAEIELRSGKRIQVIDINSSSIPRTAIMPGAPVPPFHVDPDFRREIKFYYAAGTLPENDEEATVASVLTSIGLILDGYPQSRLSPIKARAYGMTSEFELAEIDAIQKWLHQGLLSFEAERRVCARGFVRDNVHFNAIESFLAQPGMRLPARSISILRAVDQALIKAQVEFGVLPEEPATIAREVIEATTSSIEKDAGKILDLIVKNRTATPAQFTACYEQILALWDFRDFIELGYVDRRTGYIKGDSKSLLGIYRELKARQERQEMR